MSIIVDPNQLREIVKNELPDVTEESLARILYELSLSGGQFKEISHEGQLGAEMMVNCEDVCIVGELHAHKKKLRIFVDEGA